MRLPGPWLRTGLAVLIAGALGACEESTGTRAMAMQVTKRDQLVGGPRALGDVGDFVLSNGRIRAVVQGASASRGFGVFGGSLIDVDLERPRSTDEGRPVGGDGLAEIFPAFFLQGLEPTEVFIKSDGSDGGPAVITAHGKPAEFITQVKPVNELFLGTGFEFWIDYVIEPVPADAGPEIGRSILIRATMVNVSEDDISFAVDSFPVGFGLVMLMGSEHKLFLSGEAGWDLRYTLERSYDKPVPLPGIPGVVSRALGASGPDVSYILTPEPSEKLNFVYNCRDAKGKPLYPGATNDSLIVPFVSSSFTGVFFHRPPRVLAPKRKTTYEARLWVGTGDIASALNLALQHKGEALGAYTATVREEGTGVPLADVTVSIIEEESRHVVTSARSGKDGRLYARVPPGRYLAAAVASHRFTRYGEPFDIARDGTVHQELSIGQTAHLSATVIDQDGRPVPAKLSIIGSYGPENVGKPPAEFLFDLRIREPFVFTDRLEDDPERPETREFLERTLRTGTNGHTEGAIRPGKYRVVASRGPFYTVAEQSVELAPGAAQHLQFQLEKVVDMEGYIAGDFHVHTKASIDATMSFEDRAHSFAAEGIDYIAITEHNYVNDLRPTLERTGLADWVQSTVGLELTTLELGHFNGYPLAYDPGPISHGSFDWFRHPAQTLFDNFRSRSMFEDEPAVVQINHPRDTTLGYFNAFNLDEGEAKPSPFTGFVKPHGPEFEFESWSEDFDAIELINGKHTEFIHTYRVPEMLPPPPLPERIPAAGEIVRDKNGKPAFPGGFEDWFAMMKRGRVYTGMANSDTHELLENEAGYPRSMVRIGKSVSTARAIETRDVVRGIKSQSVLMTYGPVIEVFANGKPMGELVSAPGGEVTLDIKVKAAPWIDVTRVELTDSHGNKESLPVTGEGIVRLDTQLTKKLSADTFFVVEAYGEKSMWPVCPGIEIPPMMIDDAVAAIGGPFGLGDDGFGNLRPALVHDVLPYALTNPIWIDVDGDGVSYGKGARKVQELRQAPRTIEKGQPRQLYLPQLLKSLSR